MSTTKRILAVTTLIAFATLPACNSLIDDPDGPNVVLEAENVQIGEVAGITDPLDPTVCVFTIEESTATFKNKPKNQYSGSQPFQDITMQGVSVNYTWLSGPITPDRSFGIAGSVPANGTAPGSFFVLQPVDIPGHEAQIANLVLTFFGVTVSGETLSYTTGGAVAVGSCL